MDFTIPETIQTIAKTIETFIREELIPLEKDFLSGNRTELMPELENKRRRVQELGLWLPHLPKEYGGMGLSLTEFAHVSEKLGFSPLGHYIFNCQAPDVGNMELLLHFGTAEQKEKYLIPLAKGEIRSCFAMTEPEFAGSNPTQMGTMAEKDGDDYVINGHKWFASAADGAEFAIVMALTDADAESRYMRASQIIVPTDTQGYEFVRNIPVMGHAGEGYFSHGELRFTNCRVPQSNRIGEEGSGFALAQERLGPGRIHHCMRWIGICERALELMCQYAATREVAPDRPLATRHVIQSWIAESRAQIDAARLLVLHATWKIDQDGAYAARNEISLIKFYVAGVLQEVLDRAIQVHGGLGVTDYTPLAFWYRHERAGRIYDGPDEVHKAVVARRLLSEFGIQVRM
jgi:acyl-CoA dehydrogenase